MLHYNAAERNNYEKTFDLDITLNISCSVNYSLRQ